MDVGVAGWMPYSGILSSSSLVEEFLEKYYMDPASVQASGDGKHLGCILVDAYPQVGSSVRSSLLPASYPGQFYDT